MAKEIISSQKLYEKYVAVSLRQWYLYVTVYIVNNYPMTKNESIYHVED